MASTAVEEQLLAALEQEALQHDIDIVDVEVAGSKARPTVRVRIDVLDGTAIDMDRVCDETPWISGVVEALDPFENSYDLEVSSPGVDRPLRRAKDFAAHVGERAEIRSLEAIDNRRAWTGEIVEVANDEVHIMVDGTTYAVPLGKIKSAKLKPDYDAMLAAAKKATRIEEDPQDDDEA
ncbi:MAG: ribosome maturation factor RimP [Coriobacteriales bacterium]|nr:ribosome maturation factor RimP [Coriobacteriales bacterium]